jgi:hypothetical protein
MRDDHRLRLHRPTRPRPHPDRPPGRRLPSSHALASKLVDELVKAADDKHLTKLITTGPVAAPSGSSRSSPNETNAPRSPSPPTGPSQPGPRPSPQTAGSAPPSSTGSLSPARSSKSAATPTDSLKPETPDPRKRPGQIKPSCWGQVNLTQPAD